MSRESGRWIVGNCENPYSYMCKMDKGYYQGVAVVPTAVPGCPTGIENFNNISVLYSL